MAQHEMRLAIAQLQVEEKGREVAKLQGRVAGYKELVSNIANNFGLTQFMLEDNGDEPVKIPDMKDEELDVVNYDAKNLLARPEWKQVMDRVESNIYAWKESLFYYGDCVRDLDIAQGKHTGQKIFESFFNSVFDEVARRAKEAAEKAKQPSLFNESGKVLAFEGA
jgi:hypothetical protein